METEDKNSDKADIQDTQVYSRSVETPLESPPSVAEPVTYRLYRRRFVGLVALVRCNLTNLYSFID